MYPVKATHSSQPFEGEPQMNSRPIRNRRIFRLEALEVRNAPSHLGLMGHAAVAMHKLHAAAHVRHFTDSRSTDKHETQEKNSGADRSQDQIGSETSSVDSSRNDSSSNDSNSTDLKSIDPSSPS
jgi:hypothetical protein